MTIMLAVMIGFVAGGLLTEWLHQATAKKRREQAELERLQRLAAERRDRPFR